MIYGLVSRYTNDYIMGSTGFDCKLRLNKRTKKLTPKVINMFNAPLRAVA